MGTFDLKNNLKWISGTAEGSSILFRFFSHSVLLIKTSGITFSSFFFLLAFRTFLALKISQRVSSLCWVHRMPFCKIYLKFSRCKWVLVTIVFLTLNKVKGALMQIWKSPCMLVFIWKQYPENFASLVLSILELFTREVWKFRKK